MYSCLQCSNVTPNLLSCTPVDPKEKNHLKHSYCFSCWEELEKIPGAMKPCAGTMSVAHTATHIIGTGPGQFEALTYDQYKRTYKGVITCEQCQCHVDVKHYKNHRDVCAAVFQNRQNQQLTPLEETNRRLERQLDLLIHEKTQAVRDAAAAQDARFRAETALTNYENAHNLGFAATNPKEQVLKLRADIKVLKRALKEDQEIFRQQTLDGVAAEQLAELKACFEQCEKIRQSIEDSISVQNDATEAYRNLNEGKEYYYRTKVQKALFQSRVGNEMLRIPGVEMVSDVWSVRRLEPLQRAHETRCHLVVRHPGLEGGKFEKEYALTKPMEALYKEIQREIGTDESINFVAMGLLYITAEDIEADSSLQLQHIAHQFINENDMSTEMTLQVVSDDALKQLQGDDDENRPTPLPILWRQVDRFEPNGPLTVADMETVCQRQRCQTGAFRVEEHERYIKQYYQQLKFLRRMYIKHAESSMRQLKAHYSRMCNRYPDLMDDEGLEALKTSAADIFPWLREDYGSDDDDPGVFNSPSFNNPDNGPDAGGNGAPPANDGHDPTPPAAGPSGGQPNEEAPDVQTEITAVEPTDEPDIEVINLVSSAENTEPSDSPDEAPLVNESEAEAARRAEDSETEVDEVPETPPRQLRRESPNPRKRKTPPRKCKDKRPRPAYADESEEEDEDFEKGLEVFVGGKPVDWKPIIPLIKLRRLSEPHPLVGYSDSSSDPPTQQSPHPSPRRVTHSPRVREKVFDTKSTARTGEHSGRKRERSQKWRNFAAEGDQKCSASESSDALSHQPNFSGDLSSTDQTRGHQKSQFPKVSQTYDGWQTH